jgi:ribosomal protein S18 acetylase RimI-like enzyme
MNIAQILDKEELDILKEKVATFNELKFEFKDKYLKELKNGLTLKNAIQLMASDKGDFQGYIAGHENEIWKGLLQLKELFVDPKHQGKGIGTTLVSQLIEKAKEMGLDGLVTQTEPENIPAQGLYEKLGFTKVANKDWLKGITYKLLFGEDKKL